VERSEVGVGPLLPANEDATEAVEPGLGALDDAAAGAEGGLAFERLRLSPRERTWAVKPNSAASSYTSGRSCLCLHTALRSLRRAARTREARPPRPTRGSAGRPRSRSRGRSPRAVPLHPPCATRAGSRSSRPGRGRAGCDSRAGAPHSGRSGSICAHTSSGICQPSSSTTSPIVYLPRWDEEGRLCGQSSGPCLTE
jgi:hypothetical protein